MLSLNRSNFLSGVIDRSIQLNIGSITSILVYIVGGVPHNLRATCPSVVCKIKVVSDSQSSDPAFM